MPKPTPKMIADEEQKRAFLKKLKDAVNFSALFSPEYDSERGLSKWVGQDNNLISKIMEYFGQPKKEESPEASGYREQILGKLEKINAAVSLITSNEGGPNSSPEWENLMKDLRDGEGLTELLDSYNQATDFRFVSDEGVQAAMGVGRGAGEIQSLMDSQVGKERYREATKRMFNGWSIEDGAELNGQIQTFAANTFSAYSISAEKLDKHLEDLNNAVASLEKREAKLEEEIKADKRKLEAIESPTLFSARTNLLMARMMQAAYEVVSTADAKGIENPREYMMGMDIENSSAPRSVLFAVKRAEKAEKELRDQLSAFLPADKIDERIHAIKNRSLESFNPEKLTKALEDSEKEFKAAGQQKKIPGSQAKALGIKIKANQDLLDTITDQKDNLIPFRERYTGAKKRFNEIGSEYDNMKEQVVAAIQEVSPFTVTTVSEELKAEAGKLIDKSSRGKKAGHEDSPEFKDMVKSLRDYQENPTSENLQRIGAKADFYLQKKKERLHSRLFSSSMRYQRLAFAEELKNFSKKGIEKTQAEESISFDALRTDHILKGLPFEKQSFEAVVTRAILEDSGRTPEQYGKEADRKVSEEISEVRDIIKDALNKNKEELELAGKTAAKQKEGSLEASPEASKEPVIGF